MLRVTATIAGFICEATLRSKMSWYSLFSSGDLLLTATMCVGRMPSCAPPCEHHRL